MSKLSHLLFMLKVSTILLSCFTFSCVDTGAEQLRIPLYVSATALDTFGVLSQQPEDEDADLPSIELEPGQYLLLDQAKLAFGSLYFCAGTNAGDLCENAQAEWLGSVVINLLNDQVVPAGDLIGHSGMVRSWMFDLGLSSLLTHRKPYELEAAQELGGASLVLSGRILKISEGDSNDEEKKELPFSLSMKIQQNDETELGVPVIRKSASTVFEHDLSSNDSSLLIQFSLESWLKKLNFSSYFSTETLLCEEMRLEDVESHLAPSCNGTIEQYCDPETGELQMRDCSQFAQYCLPDFGCMEELELTNKTQQYRTIRNAVLLEGRPNFIWNQL